MTKFSVELHRALDEWFELCPYLSEETYQFIKNRCNIVNK